MIYIGIHTIAYAILLVWWVWNHNVWAVLIGFFGAITGLASLVNAE